MQPQSAFSGPQSVLPKAPAREKKKLSLVDPNTGKAIDLGGGELLHNSRRKPLLVLTLAGCCISVSACNAVAYSRDVDK